MKNIQKFLNIKPGFVKEIKKTDFDTLFESSELINESETHMAGPIRIFKLRDRYFLQETTDKGKTIVRKVESLSDAEDLIQQRLDKYEKMWDGCGCRVDYYA